MLRIKKLILQIPGSFEYSAFKRMSKCVINCREIGESELINDVVVDAKSSSVQLRVHNHSFS